MEESAHEYNCLEIRRVVTYLYARRTSTCKKLGYLFTHVMLNLTISQKYAYLVVFLYFKRVFSHKFRGIKWNMDIFTITLDIYVSLLVYIDDVVINILT